MVHILPEEWVQGFWLIEGALVIVPLDTHDKVFAELGIVDAVHGDVVSFVDESLCTGPERVVLAQLVEVPVEFGSSSSCVLVAVLLRLAVRSLPCCWIIMMMCAVAAT